MTCDGRLPELLMRADASGQIGFGHLVRTCAMAGNMRHNFRCRIYSWDSTGAPLSDWARQQAADAGAEISAIEASTMQEADRAFIDILDASPEPPLTVLDNYYFQADYQREVRRRSKALICLDDMHDRHFVADLLISFVPLPRSLFSMDRHTQFLSGFRYASLREPFMRPRRNLPRGSVVVAMGGADPLGLTDRIVPMLRKAMPEPVIEIVAGAGVRIGSAIDGLYRTVVHRNLNAGEMAALFDRAMLGVFPASTICLEAFSRQCPVAAGFFTGNQLDFYRTGVDQGLFIPLGDLRTTDLSPLRNLSALPSADNLPDFQAGRNELISQFRRLVGSEM